MPEKEIIPVTNDVMFKALFVKCPEALAGFLASALKIERSTIKNVRIKNPELTPSCYEGKLTRLDILLELDDDVINIEMQVSKTADYKDRSLFYWARVYNDALKEGQSYNESKKCICINILNFTMFEEWEEYHSSFSVREDTHNVRLTDKLEIHFLELTKVKKITRDQNEVDSLKLWMQLFKAKSKEELDMLSNTTVDDIRTSVSVIYDLSEDEKLREYIRQREKAEFDYQSDMANDKYKYVVICSYYEGKFMLSRHRRRTTWETQGGHIEAGETPMEAAKRELYEESGVTDAEIIPVCDYNAWCDAGDANGVVFAAVINTPGELPESEMAEVKFFDKLPDELTYPLVTPVLFEETAKEARKYYYMKQVEENR